MVSLTSIGAGVLLSAGALILISRYAPADIEERLTGVGAGASSIISAPLIGISRGMGEFGEEFSRFGRGVQEGLGAIGQATAPLGSALSELFAFSEKLTGGNNSYPLEHPKGDIDNPKYGAGSIVNLAGYSGAMISAKVISRMWDEGLHVWKYEVEYYDGSKIWYQENQLVSG